MVVRVSGQSVAVPLGLPLQPPQFFDGGVLGQPTNSGRTIRSEFAVLPEAVIKLGYRFRDRSRFYVGYNFLYLSSVLRPGDQIDPGLDVNRIPNFPLPGTIPRLATVRPGVPLKDSDVFVQGISFSLQWKW